MKRRNFLKNTGLFLSIGALLKSSGILGGMNMSALAASPLFNQLSTENDRILILIQLVGGNDGLNTLIPLDSYDNLAKLRSNIIIPPKKIIKINDHLGFHPALTGFSELFNDHQLCIVQNAGYPSPNRSHFRSSDIWNTGSPSSEVWTTGWLGRYFDKFHPNYPVNFPNTSFPDPIAINMGNSVSETCQGKNINFGFALSNPDELADLNQETMEEVIPAEYNSKLKFISTNIEQTNAYSKVILQANSKGRNLASYPDGNVLAQQLKVISRLISGGLKTKIFVLTLNDFDTHANQTTQDDPCQGQHTEKLKTLSSAVKSFQDDLKLLHLDNRVIGMVTSEFGRQIESNNSYGTDHGDAAPLFVFGSSIKNTVIGSNPVIPSKVDVQAGVPMQIDFRDVYGSLLTGWMGLQTADFKAFFQKDLTPLSIV